MNRWKRLLDRLRQSKANVSLGDLESLLRRAGLEMERQEGSHRIFKHPTRPDAMVNLQRAKDGKAKPYQVRQVLKLLDDLGIDFGEESESSKKKDEP